MQEFVKYELTLPIGPDSELVAASTTERIAYLTSFDERTMMAVRLAVIEACIDAFEHSPVSTCASTLRSFWKGLSYLFSSAILATALTRFSSTRLAFEGSSGGCDRVAGH
jgi:hypothetical protein